jgi:hypothetical protein
MRLHRFSEPRFRRTGLAALAFLLLPFAAHTTFAQPKPAPTGAPLPAGPKPAPTGAAAAVSTGAPKSPAGPKIVPGKAAASALAAAAAPPPAVEGDEAGRLYVEGFAAVERGAYNEAEISLSKAWSLSKSFDVAAALGSTKLELGKHREAAQYLSFALRNALPSTRAGVRDRIKRDLDNARRKLATVKLTVSLLEAKIAIDGAPLDPLFLGPEVYVDPGKRTFEATADGYTAAKSTIDAKVGEVAVVALTLERTSAPKSGGPPLGEQPEQSVPVPAAILGGLGGAAIVAGAVLAGASVTSFDRAKELSINTLTPDGKPTCPIKGPGPTERCDEVRSAAASSDAFGNAAIGVFIGGGVLIAGATVYMFLRPKPASAPSDQKAPAATSQIVPVVGTSGGGFVWRGSF